MDLPDDFPRIILRKQYSNGKTLFRVNRVVERLTERPGASPESTRYVITVYGPVVTANGNDHKTNRGDAEFGDGRLGQDIDDIPPAIREILVGRGALSGALDRVES